MFMGEQPGKKPEESNTAFGVSYEEYLKRKRKNQARIYRHYPKDYSNPELQFPELCAECGGSCCKNCGCTFSPDDFEDLSFDSLKAEIEKGYIAIDAVDGDQFAIAGIYKILRVRNVGEPVYGGRRGGPCVLLAENGCKLDFEHRPAGGKLMVPAEATYCPTYYHTDQAIREWSKYQEVLDRLAGYFYEKEIECTL